MLGGPKMIQPVEPQNEFLKGNIKEPVNIEVMGKPSPVKPIEPEPIGGTDAMNDFIDANIRWPEKLDHNLTVFVQVRIDKEGRVYNAYIIRGFRADVDSEAIRVARLIKFTPARNLLGDVTESVLTIPVNFTYRQQ
jgi:TonB family protein